MGGDSFQNIRYPLRHTPGGCAHLPDIEGVSGKMIKFGLLLVLYPLLQVAHRLALRYVNREGRVGLVENPTEELEFVT
jgi:hypothetical protein